MTAYLAPRPEDVYDAETVAGFRAAGYWRDETLSASVDRLAGQDRVVLTDGYGALTGTELREQAYRLAAALRRLGVGAGDRVQVQLPNWNEFVVVYVALARIGRSSEGAPGATFSSTSPPVICPTPFAAKLPAVVIVPPSRVPARRNAKLPLRLARLNAALGACPVEYPATCRTVSVPRNFAPPRETT